MAPLTNALIANVWDAGYWDHAQGKTVCKKMNMLDEIRRERACELFGEGFRMDDLKRWGIAHINLTGQKLGRHVLGTAYETEKAMMLLIWRALLLSGKVSVIIWSI